MKKIKGLTTQLPPPPLGSHVNAKLYAKTYKTKSREKCKADDNVCFSKQNSWNLMVSF